MKYFTTIIATLFLLTSCTRYYKEVWYVEKYPVEWHEEVVIPQQHFHYKDSDDSWRCFYDYGDTVCLTIRDTIELQTLHEFKRIK